MTEPHVRPPEGTAPALGAREPPRGPLVATDVCYHRAGRSLLDHVSLLAPPGQVIAVTGPSGSGKSSLLALLGGLERPDTGTVRHPPTARLGFVLQAYGLANLLTAAENIEIALQPHLAAGRLTRADIRRSTADMLERVGLSRSADHLVEELSGGQQQRVAIARALIAEPDILLADEFAAELDHTAKQQALELILAVARRGGIVVVATHDPDIAERCHQVLHLTDGHLRP
ncbi:MAG TPA: ATP-binding cassette domain-containing protein [Trebonia sp.]